MCSDDAVGQCFAGHDPTYGLSEPRDPRSGLLWRRISMCRVKEKTYDA
jgi:hypothetical protein